jgi:hypothetical protein
MAVIQISKIQLRRGREQEEGIPQLASGELAWAIDTQKLFIGNGAVSEGAPQVGNTRILTEQDNIFELAQDYQYKESNSAIQTGLSTNFPVQLTLQERLDERVTNVEYGIEANGIDQTAKIQNAIDNLFLNSSYMSRNDLRVTLEFLPGTYFVSSTIFLPSNVTIVGAGIDKTVFHFTGLSQPVFRFINETSTKTSRSTLSSTTSLNQPKNSILSGFSVITNDPTVNGFQLSAVKDSVFKDIKIQGSYGDSASNFSKGIVMEALSSLVTCQRNKFDRVIIDGMTYGVYSENDIINNIFLECEIRDAYIGFSLGPVTPSTAIGKQYGPRNIVVEDSIFEDVDRQGIYVYKGYGNRSIGNTFRNVGNEGGRNTNNQTAIIRYDSHGNVSIGDSFDRRINTDQVVNNPLDLVTNPEDLASNRFDLTYIAEVQGKVYQDMAATASVTLATTFASTNFLRIPVDSDASIEISYLLRSSNDSAPQYNQVRKGVIHLTVDYLNIDNVQQHVRLVDDYEYVGEEFDDDNIIFTASISGGEVFVSYVNYNGSDESIFDYKYKYLN